MSTGLISDETMAAHAAYLRETLARARAEGALDEVARQLREALRVALDNKTALTAARAEVGDMHDLLDALRCAVSLAEVRQRIGDYLDCDGEVEDDEPWPVTFRDVGVRP
jgi:predicted RNA-binding Zn ribbon-like protein